MSRQCASPRPHEPDVQLSIFLHGIRFDFLACRTAALTFIDDHNRRHYVDAAAILPRTADHPRLPNERLYLSARGELRATRVQDAVARWFVSGGVINLVSVTHDSGHTTHFDGIHLGACFDAIPRALWNRIRRDYERDRPTVQLTRPNEPLCRKPILRLVRSGHHR
ncbi:hypothetical protein [Nocardia arizonensis]|uniref:hypothetical protein n=1 Tax=Nocardia arizonensis TaxID=1141647 RepID=UPI0006D20753|nr:hypothetical protein [Nocardia arizonensis]